MKFFIGDLVKIRQRTSLPKGFGSFPGEYGFHAAVILSPHSTGVILEFKELFCRILFNDGRQIWLEHSQIEKISRQSRKNTFLC